MPDGDTIGSCLALYRFLVDEGHEAYIVLDDVIPFDVAGFIHEPIYSVADYDVLKVEANLVFCIDFSDLERLGEKRIPLMANLQTINLDHHKTNTYYATINVVDTHASATGEIIFDLIQLSGLPLKKEYAEPIYVAISTDTGSFKYSNTTGRTHSVISKLYETGIEVADINRTLYQNTPFHRLRLHAEAMNHLELYHHNSCALIYVSLEMLDLCHALPQDSDGLVEAIRDIRGMELVVFLKEIEPQIIKVSMRSKKTIDVSAIALGFNGGGHKHAAGFTLNMSLAEALNKVRILVGNLQ
jgi:phosphoesterase RecJ-like protein